MRLGPKAVEVESLEIAVASSLVVKVEQKVLWRNESEHWSERISFMKLRSLGDWELGNSGSREEPSCQQLC